MYLVLPLEVEPGQRTLAEDAWVLAREAFSPCYIGGWSAAEHWGLTEQLFRLTLVITASNVRQRSASLLGREFLLFRAPRSRISGPGITVVWRGPERVPVSSPERTIVDCLRHPELCGGIRNVTDLMREYGGRKDKRFDVLVAEAERVASGAAWKRLGYLAELHWPDASEVIAAARKHVTAGNVRLDPAVRRRGNLTTRWRLWANVPLILDSRT
jgi:predicted transcriptional regulator of viral defense system